MPLYVDAVFALAFVCLILAAALPTPQMPPSRAGAVCLALVTGGVVTCAAACVMIVLVLTTTLPGYVVVAPALAVIGLGLALWLTMFWLSAAPAPLPRSAAEEPGGDDDDGGGGLPPVDEPPRDPGPPQGIPWDAFDRERQGWEPLTAPGREFAGV